MLLALAVAAPVTPLASLAAPSPAVADVRPGFKAADEPLIRTESFGYTGAEASFTVPAGVTELTVVATGARGGVHGVNPAPLTAGGRAARVSGDLAVTPGQVLLVRVGGRGVVPSNRAGGAGGWNGGADGGATSATPPLFGVRGGAGGGGATDLRTCGAGDPGCVPLDSRLLVAAGGGGSGGISCGGCNYGADPIAGGDAGSAGAGYAGGRGSVTGGGAATATAGGAGGVSNANSQFDHIAHGTDGAFGAGGATASADGYFGSGGGGGGWYGGGSGAANRYYGAGGGGGSSLVPAGGSSELVARNVAAGLAITYDAGVLEDVAVSVNDVPMVATGKDTRVVTATATTEKGLPYPGLDLSFTSNDPDHSFGTVVDRGDGTYTATLTGSTTVGTATITATAAGSVPSADVSGTTSVVTEGYDIAVAVDDDAPLVATGEDERIVTATATSDSDRPVSGLDISFDSTDDDQWLGEVTDNGDGTYSATLVGSTTTGPATITATSAASVPTADVSGSTSVVTEGYEVSVELDDTTPMIATGEDEREVIATATSESDRPVTGLEMSFESTDADQSFGEVTDNEDGTYTATLAGSTTAEPATVTATAAEGDVSGTTSVDTERYELTVSFDGDGPLVATGWDEREVTVTAATVESERPVLNLDLTFTSTDAEQGFDDVTDNEDGTWTATLVGSTKSDTATITATAAEGNVTGVKAIVTEGYTVTVRSTPSRLVATGQATADVTAEARTASGRALPGLDLRITSSDPAHVIGAVSDRGDGTYTARVTGSTTVGSAELSAVVTGAGSPAVVDATLQTDPYAVPTLAASVASSSPATNGWYRTPVTVSFACAGTLFTAACPSPVVLSTQGPGQTVNRSIADAIGRTAEVTAGPISIDTTPPTLKVAGVKKGKTYPRPQKLACQATDALSGVETCKVTTKKRAIKKGKKKVGTRITWAAIASDKAGNTSTANGSYLVKPRRR